MKTQCFAVALIAAVSFLCTESISAQTVGTGYQNQWNPQIQQQPAGVYNNQQQPGINIQQSRAIQQSPANYARFRGNAAGASAYNNVTGPAGDSGCGNDCGAGCGSGCGAGCGLGSRLGGFRQNDPCRYYSLFGGWSRAEDVAAAFSVTGAAAAQGSIDLELNDGWAMGAAVGRRIRPNLRFEGEFTYRNMTHDHITGTGAAAALGQINIDGKSNLYSGMANLVFDFNCFNRIVPYVGVGAGVVFVKADIVEPTTPITIDLDYSTFAYQGILGVSTCLNSRADLFGEYRLFGTDKTEVGFSGLGSSANAELDAVTHNFFVGVRIKSR